MTKSEDTTNASKRPRLFIILYGNILLTAPTLLQRQIPIPIDNHLPAIIIQFGSCAADAVEFTCHVDSCAGMNTGSLLLHQWMITNYVSCYYCILYRMQ